MEGQMEQKICNQFINIQNKVYAGSQTERVDINNKN